MLSSACLIGTSAGFPPTRSVSFCLSWKQAQRSYSWSHSQNSQSTNNVLSTTKKNSFNKISLNCRPISSDSKPFTLAPPEIPSHDFIHQHAHAKKPQSAHLSQDSRKAHSALESHGSEHHGGYAGAKHQLRHRATEKIGMKIAEKTTAKLLPRLFARLQKRIGMKLLLRKVLRGVAIALPAIGGIFASIVTVYDATRAMREREKGNHQAAVAFAFAAVWDVVDVAAHAVTTLVLSGYLAHAYEHTSETVSLVAAVVATSAAIVGEIFGVQARIAAEEAAGVSEDAIERSYDASIDGIICNSDGVLTAKAVSVLARLFKAHDVNNDGHLDRHELSSYLASCTGKKPQKGELDYLLATFKSGEDGLTETGFFAMYSTQTLQNPAQTWRDLRAHGINDSLVKIL